ncbi:MAG: hypothetical protein HYS51_02280 [Candidatus Zambryskibacteria bacterium]|nr:hypothetical protein [Candidatus Zambryskibacteria bacterium]
MNEELDVIKNALDHYLGNYFAVKPELKIPVVKIMLELLKLRKGATYQFLACEIFSRLEAEPQYAAIGGVGEIKWISAGFNELTDEEAEELQCWLSGLIS